MKYWYQISAQNGYVLGQYSYAHFLSVDSRSEQECYRAIYWFGVAAKSGHKLSKKHHDNLLEGVNGGENFSGGCSKRYSKGH